MRKLYSALAIFALFSSAPLLSEITINNLVSVHMSIIVSDQVNINAWWYYKNMGIITALDTTINTRSFSNSGSINSTYTDIKSKNCCITGTVSGSQKCLIKTNVLEGNGTITGDNVSIMCDEFKFNGTISAQKCTIYTKQSFDYNIFKRDTNGKYTIIISKNESLAFTQESLHAYATTSLIENCLSLGNNSIEDEIKKIRSYAALNKIEDAKLLEKLKDELKEQIHYNATRTHYTRGSDADFNNGICWGSLGSIAGATTALAALYPKSLEKRFSIDESTSFTIAILAGAASGFAYLKSYGSLSKWLNPRYKERCEKLALILTEIEQSLITPRIPEEEIIEL